MSWSDPASPGTLIILVLLGGPVLLVGLVHLIALPLAVRFEVRAARRRGVRTLWDQWPSVSIIVPARNASGALAGCLRSIGLTGYARYEVILVDDGSTDDTAEAMAALAAADPRIKVLGQARAGQGAALNLGVRHATGDVVMVAGAGGTFARDAIDRMLQGFEDPGTGVVCGAEVPAAAEPLTTRALAFPGRLGAGIARRALSELGGLPVAAGPVIAFPRRVLAKIGPFREDAADAALELAWRVHGAGYRVGFAPGARIAAGSAATVRDLWRQRDRRVGGLLQAVAVHVDLAGSRGDGDLVQRRLPLPLAPVCTVFTALSMLAARRRSARARSARGAVRARTSRAGTPAVPGPDARRALRDAWTA